MHRPNTGAREIHCCCEFPALIPTWRIAVVSFLGAHQRQNIQKNMQERSKAVRNQINDVNHLGLVIGLRPNVNFESVTGDDIRQLFVVLGHLRTEGSIQPAWTKPSCREAVRLHLETRRAKEELLRLAVE